MTEGLLVFVQEVMAAMTTAPCLKLAEPPFVPIVASALSASGLSSNPAIPHGCGERLVESSSHLGERHTILRALGPGQGWDDRGKVEFQGVGEKWVRRGRIAE